MSKEEFLRQLQRYLKRLPQSEINDALQFYSEYLDEAQDVQAAIRELGDPRQVAASIRAESAAKRMERDPNARNVFRSIGIVALAVFASPIAIPLAVVLAAAILLILLAILLVVLALFLAGVYLALTGVAFFSVSFFVLVQSIPTFLFFLGTGLFCMGLGVIFTLGMLGMARSLFRTIARIMEHILRRRVTA